MAQGGDMLTVAQAKEAVGELVQHFYEHLEKWSTKVVPGQSFRYPIVSLSGQPHCPMVVDEIVKAGSLGHGTAVPGDFDLDMVIYSQSIDRSVVKWEGYRRWLDQLKRFLAETLKDEVKDIHQTVHSVQFTYKGMIEVDLLVSPKWEDPADLYGFLATVPKSDRHRFSVSASKWQVQFFQDESQVPQQAKEFIKRAKAWRNVVWAKNRAGKPKSFTLSLLVLFAHKIADGRLTWKNKGRIAEKTTQVLQNLVKRTMAVDNSLLKRTRRLNICWEKFYRRRDYPRLMPSRPRIVDPGNPTNNLYETGISSSHGVREQHDYDTGCDDWERFKSKIDSLDLTKTVEEILQMEWLAI